MQAVRIHAHGGPEVLRVEELPDPKPAAGEVLVRVLAVSVNHLDLFVRAGLPGVKLPLPLIPGCDGTGVIVALGAGVSSPAVGTRVVIEPGATSGKSKHDLEGNDHLSDDYQIRGEHFDGLDRELVCLPARYVFPLPDKVDPVVGAAANLVYLTAWGMVVTRAGLAGGETILVIGGTSGVGMASIQIAKDLGARVLTTAGSEAKRKRAIELGADAAVDHSKEGWEREIKGLTGGRGVDVVVEHVGPATWDLSMRSLARNGRLVTCGGTTGPKVSLTLPHVFIKNLSVLGSTMGPRTALPRIFEKIQSGAYKPAVDRVLPLSDIAAAHAALEAREVSGKIVLIPGR
ncbi:MAG TPA: zinc-binding dehydrogenase [Planctomycetota bacterium]|nr:zinc-binding dehydrogenase [Planctomycetota bacterium]